MARPYKEGKGWCVRKRYQGQDIYLSGFESKSAVDKALREAISAQECNGKPQHLGPQRLTLACALQAFGLEHLRRLKGAPQEVRRINKYLDAAGLRLLAVCPTSADSTNFYDVSLLAHDAQRRVPHGLTQHRKALLCKTAGSNRLRQVLSQTVAAKITRGDIQRLMDSLASDGLSPSTLALERAVLRGFFNHARTQWAWAQPADNPATGLRLPRIDNARDRVLSLKEQVLLDSAFDSAHNDALRHVVVLLRETAMRASEPLLHATWAGVDWERRVLQLSDGKDGKRDVPLSPAALEALRALGPGEPDQRIVSLSYEALKAGMRRACERAGIANLHIHDLRHTAATRMGLATGNIFLVQALTGHKTLEMVRRYVNVKADDVVEVLHRERPAALASQGANAAAHGETGHGETAATFLMDAQQLQALVTKAVGAAMALAVQTAHLPSSECNGARANALSLRGAA